MRQVTALRMSARSSRDGSLFRGCRAPNIANNLDTGQGFYRPLPRRCGGAGIPISPFLNTLGVFYRTLPPAELYNATLHATCFTGQVPIALCVGETMPSGLTRTKHCRDLVRARHRTLFTSLQNSCQSVSYSSDWLRGCGVPGTCVHGSFTQIWAGLV